MQPSRPLRPGQPKPAQGPADPSNPSRQETDPLLSISPSTLSLRRHLPEPLCPIPIHLSLVLPFARIAPVPSLARPPSPLRRSLVSAGSRRRCLLPAPPRHLLQALEHELVPAAPSPSPSTIVPAPKRIARAPSPLQTPRRPSFRWNACPSPFDSAGRRDRLPRLRSPSPTSACVGEAPQRLLQLIVDLALPLPFRRMPSLLLGTSDPPVPRLRRRARPPPSPHCCCCPLLLSLSVPASCRCSRTACPCCCPLKALVLLRFGDHMDRQVRLRSSRPSGCTPT